MFFMFYLLNNGYSTFNLVLNLVALHISCHLICARVTKIVDKTFGFLEVILRSLEIL